MDHRPHIVVVEDEAAQRQLLLDYLAKQNFHVSGADGGAAFRREADAVKLLFFPADQNADVSTISVRSAFGGEADIRKCGGNVR